MSLFKEDEVQLKQNMSSIMCSNEEFLRSPVHYSYALCVMCEYLSADDCEIKIETRQSEITIILYDKIKSLRSRNGITKYLWERAIYQNVLGLNHSVE